MRSAMEVSMRRTAPLTCHYLERLSVPYLTIQMTRKLPWFHTAHASVQGAAARHAGPEAVT